MTTPHPQSLSPLRGEREASGDAASWIGDVGSGVTYCKNRYLHIEFLKSKAAVGKRQLGWLADLDVNSGAHGVTRPTTHWLATMRWVIVG